MKLKLKNPVLVAMLIVFSLFFSSNSVIAKDINFDAFYSSGPFNGQTIGDTQLEPLSDVTLEATLLDPRGEGICSGTGTVLRYTMAHAIGGDLKNIEYLKKGLGVTFEYTFNSGTSGQRNVYWPIFYCSNVDEPKVAVSAVNYDGSSVKFDHATVGAGTCVISNARWGASQVNPGDSVSMKVDGTLGCKGKEATFQILIPGDFRVKKEIKANFPASQTGTSQGMPVFTAMTNWTPSENGTFLFDVQVFGTESVGKFKARSGNLNVGNSGTVTEINRSEEFLPPYGISGFTDLFDQILTWLIRIAVPIGVIMITISGILMLISQGNLQKVTQAKTVLKHTIIGLAIIFIGKGFITLLESIINIGK